MVRHDGDDNRYIDRLSFDKPIAHAIDRFDHGFARGGFEFLSQILDVRVHTAVCAGGDAMQIFEQLFAGQDLAGTAGKEMQ